MAANTLTMETERVACDVCLKEIPKSEAVVPEALDYVVYFCGLGCYERWERQRGARSEQVKASA